MNHELKQYLNTVSPTREKPITRAEGSLNFKTSDLSYPHIMPAMMVEVGSRTMPASPVVSLHKFIATNLKLLYPFPCTKNDFEATLDHCLPHKHKPKQNL